MAQTGYTPILIYSSSTGGNAPAAGSLTNSTLGSELAINITDGKLFYKDNANAVQVIGWKTVPTTAGGTGLTSYTAGDLVYYATGSTFTKLAIGASGRWLGSSGTAPQWNAPAALTKTDDTNVTLTLGGSASTALLNAASLTLGWTGQLSAARGGTGIGSYAVGDILYADTTSSLAKLADVATGNALISGGVGVAPSWGKIGLTTHVSGTLGVGNGGTGTATAFTAGSVVFAGASGVYSQNNANFFWDNTNARLGVGTTAPNSSIETLGAYGRRVVSTGPSSSPAYDVFAQYYYQTNARAQIRFWNIAQSLGTRTWVSLTVTDDNGALIDGVTTHPYDGVTLYGNTYSTADNTYSCGTAARRWSVIYAGNGTINTSDGNEKTVIGNLDDAEKRVAQAIKQSIKKFQFNDAIAKKGADKARIHVGVIAQDVKAAFEAQGLDPYRYGMFCQDSYYTLNGEKIKADEFGKYPEGAVEKFQLGVRYEQLLAFVVAAM